MGNRRESWRRRALAALGFALLPAATAFATEGGGGAYPLGAENFLVGAIPPPGKYFIDYAVHYRATTFRDGSGNSIIPDFKAKVTANAFRYLHVTDIRMLGGNFGWDVVVPVLKVDVTLPGRSQSKEGVGDILVDPLAIIWYTKNYHSVAVFEMFIPTGRYDKADIANLGRNYWTFTPVYAGTYLADNGLEASFRVQYDMNTKNHATDYRSGHEFHVEYNVAQHFGKLALGLNGYYYRQTTDDEVAGAKVGPDGNRGRAFAWGPGVKYQHKNLIFVGPYQRETQVRNRPEGDKFWFKAYVPF